MSAQMPAKSLARTRAKQTTNQKLISLYPIALTVMWRRLFYGHSDHMITGTNSLTIAKGRYRNRDRFLFLVSRRSLKITGMESRSHKIGNVCKPKLSMPGGYFGGLVISYY